MGKVIIRYASNPCGWLIPRPAGLRSVPVGTWWVRSDHLLTHPQRIDTVLDQPTLQVEYVLAVIAPLRSRTQRMARQGDCVGATCLRRVLRGFGPLVLGQPSSDYLPCKLWLHPSIVETGLSTWPDVSCGTRAAEGHRMPRGDEYVEFPRNRLSNTSPVTKEGSQPSVIRIVNGRWTRILRWPYGHLLPRTSSSTATSKMRSSRSRAVVPLPTTGSVR